MWWADFTALLPLFTAQILYLDLINQLKLSKWHKLWLHVLGISFLCLMKTTRRRLLRILISPQHTICSISWLFSSKSWYFKVYSISHGRTKSSIGSFGRHVLIELLIDHPLKILFVSLTKYFLNFTTSSHLSQFQIDRVMFATFSLDHSSFLLYLIF